MVTIQPKMSRGVTTESLSSDHELEQDHCHSSSYFGSMGFCQVFDCMEGWSAILSWNPQNDEDKIPKTQHHGVEKKQPGSYSERIDPLLFRNPLAEKMVEDALERAKYNTKSQRGIIKSLQHGNCKDHHDKSDDLIDQRIAIAARRKKRQRQQVQTRLQGQPLHPSAISYSRRQHWLHQKQVAHQNQKDTNQASQSPLLKICNRKKMERPQTPIPAPGPSRLNPKASKQANQIVPKRRPPSSRSSMTLLKRKDPNESKRQSPPTTYCPPVSTPLVPIGERKAMKEKRQKIPIRWNRKVTPFQPDEYY